jgi:hypothetical protein
METIASSGMVSILSKTVFNSYALNVLKDSFNSD